MWILQLLGDYVEAWAITKGGGYERADGGAVCEEFKSKILLASLLVSVNGKLEADIA